MSRRTLVCLLVCLLTAPALLVAQPAPDQGGQFQGEGRRNRGGGPGGGGGFDPAQFRQRMMERVKEDLQAKDDEWAVIEPKLAKVMEAQAAVGAGRFGGGIGGRGRGGPGGQGAGGGRGFGGGGAAAATPTAQARQALQQTLQNPSASADEIAKNLAALREAREKARTDLANAQKELKEVLTARQEAVLVMQGTLE